MTDASILEELQDIFRDVLGPAGPGANAQIENGNNVEDWDSLAHINLVERGGRRSTRYVLRWGSWQDLKDVGDMIELIKKKVAAQ